MKWRTLLPRDSAVGDPVNDLKTVVLGYGVIGLLIAACVGLLLVVRRVFLFAFCGL